MPGPIKSLNVSNACVLALYVVGRAIDGAEQRRHVARSHPPG
jgi:hypothetical protein